MMRGRINRGLLLLVCLITPMAVSAQDPDTVTITRGSTLFLEPNYPNPFCPEDNGTTIAFSLDRDATVTLTIYDCFYNQVEYLLKEEDLVEGRHKVLYNPGLRIASGMYFYTLELTTGERLTNRLLYIR